MRFLPIAAILLSLFVTTPVANAQSKHLPRTTLDVCANLNVDLAVQLNTLLRIAIPDIFGKVQICLCIGGLAQFAQTNVVTNLATALVGSDAVIAALTILVSQAAGHQQCTFPDHSIQSCSSVDPCSFTCKDGFTKVGNTCACLSPKTVCNGVCGTTACPSGIPLRKKRHVDMCARGMDACGVYNSQGVHKRWECLSTRTNLESCGGCVIPVDGRNANGIDCTAIEGVDKVQCSNSKCQVESCRKGYKVANSADSCTKTSSA